MDTYQEAKAVVLSYFDDLEKASGDGVQQALLRHHSPAYHFYGVHPFNEVSSSDAVASAFWQPLKKSFTRVQRRQDVFIAGTSEVANDTWVMSMGHFMGLFDADWLGIPANGKLAMLRYAEFNRVEGGKITHTGMWVDIIGLMQHVGINPLPPETGHYFIYPGPRSHDGLQFEAQPELESQHTLELLNRMIQDLDLLNLSGDDNCQPEYLARTWHEDMAWYGPAGIGATYTIERYQRQHQYPFREGLTNKVYNGHVCRFAEGNYACFFGWPNLSHQPTGGFLGLPGGSPSEMRVVDVYRREGEKLSENWVLIDLPHWLLKQGLDVLERTRSIVNP
ncbi:MAG: ester cyclase [Pseudomonadota bacterium]